MRDTRNKSKDIENTIQKRGEKKNYEKETKKYNKKIKWRYNFNCIVLLINVTFRGKPQIIDKDCFYNTYGSRFTINVPWSEGEVANAPWSANSATINYNVQT